MTAINHLLPFYMENVQGLPVSETGLVFITTTLAIALTQPFSGRMADAIGSRSVATAGLVCQGLGLLSLAFIPLNMNPDWLVPQLALIGVGAGLFRSPNHRALFGSVPREKMGQAGGYQHLPRQLGESIGETSVITMFTAIVLASATMFGVSVSAPSTAPTSSNSPAVAVSSVSNVSDSNSADDTIIDVPDDTDQADVGNALPATVTQLPAEAQMTGYRLMWGLAGLVAFGGAALSWFLRDEEAEPGKDSVRTVETSRRNRTPPLSPLAAKGTMSNG